jgi:muramoyltetrapeptide carboxypeptidase LdcA involved in peptidoglycan recycling
MTVRYPRPLRPGDRIGVTAPSAGVADPLRPRLDFCCSVLRDRGYQVVVGDCIRADRYVSAPAADRAAELTGMLTDPTIRAVVPPWGGELAVDLLPLLDFAAIAAAEPTWLVGFSDISTLLTPLTLRTGIATVHGNNLMDTPYQTPAGLANWLELVTLPAGGSIEQVSPGRYRRPGFDDWTKDPTVTAMPLTERGTWRRLDGDGPVVVSGRLIGGCIETMSALAGSAFGDVTGFAQRYAPDGLLVYVEAVEDNAFSIGRQLHGMRLSGFFDAANAVLVGRTRAPGGDGFSQDDAVLDALGGLGVPILADVECGHVAPYLPLVNGALATVRYTGGTDRIEQTLV